MITAGAIAGLAEPDLGHRNTALSEQRAARAGVMARNLGLQDLAWRCDLLEAETLEKEGDLPGALALYEDAIRKVDAYRVEMIADRMRSGFLGARMQPFEAALRVSAALFDRSQDSRYGMSAIDENVSGLQNRIAQMTVGDFTSEVEILDTFFERGITFQPSQVYQHAEQQVELGMLGNHRLQKDRGF